MTRYFSERTLLDMRDKDMNYVYDLADLEQYLAGLPTADVVPKSEVDRLEYTLLGVMHSVDKWLDGEELEQDEVNRAATMREKILRIVENAQIEVAREIFEDVDTVIMGWCNSCYPLDIALQMLAELKKRYTEGKT